MDYNFSEQPPRTFEDDTASSKLDTVPFSQDDDTRLSHTESETIEEAFIPQQPITRPISQEQLMEEVKGIYAGLIMLENECNEIDTTDAEHVAAEPSSSEAPNSLAAAWVRYKRQQTHSASTANTEHVAARSRPKPTPPPCEPPSPLHLGWIRHLRDMNAEAAIAKNAKSEFMNNLRDLIQSKSPGSQEPGSTLLAGKLINRYLNTLGRNKEAALFNSFRCPQSKVYYDSLYKDLLRLSEDDPNAWDKLVVDSTLGPSLDEAEVVSDGLSRLVFSHLKTYHIEGLLNDIFELPGNLCTNLFILVSIGLVLLCTAHSVLLPTFPPMMQPELWPSRTWSNEPSPVASIPQETIIREAWIPGTPVLDSFRPKETLPSQSSEESWPFSMSPHSSSVDPADLWASPDQWSTDMFNVNTYMAMEDMPSLPNFPQEFSSTSAASPAPADFGSGSSTLPEFEDDNSEPTTDDVVWSPSSAERRCSSSHKCSDCDKSFTRTFALRRHQREQHNSAQRQFLCSNPGCKRSMPAHAFRREYHLERHRQECDRRIANENPPPQPVLQTVQRHTISKEVPKKRSRPAQRNRQLVSVLEEEYHTRLAALELKERECQKERETLEKLAAFMRSLEEEQEEHGEK